MDAASFLSSVIEIAVGIAGFAGIVAAIRQRQLSSWPPEQLILLQILFFASAASIAFGLLPAGLAEAGIEEHNIWKFGGAVLICWYVGAVSFRVRQSKALGVTMPIPKPVLVWASVALVLQIYNISTEGVAWPYLFGVTGLLINGFSVFLILVLKPSNGEQDV